MLHFLHKRFWLVFHDEFFGPDFFHHFDRQVPSTILPKDCESLHYAPQTRHPTTSKNSLKAKGQKMATTAIHVPAAQIRPINLLLLLLLLLFLLFIR